jgi:Uma2 family endonuclease
MMSSIAGDGFVFKWTRAIVAASQTFAKMSAHTETWPKPHRLTVDDYYRMAVAGVLSPDDRTELIDGEIIDMAPIGSAHAHVVRLLTERLLQAVAGAAVVSAQLPVRLSARSEPQPDIALLRARPAGYRHAHPTAGDVLLLIEVSDTTLRYDLNVKARLYATHDISEYWVVDLVANRIWHHRRPGGSQYAERTEIASGAIAIPGGFGAIEIAELF